VLKISGLQVAILLRFKIRLCSLKYKQCLVSFGRLHWWDHPPDQPCPGCLQHSADKQCSVPALLPPLQPPTYLCPFLGTTCRSRACSSCPLCTPIRVRSCSTFSRAWLGCGELRTSRCPTFCRWNRTRLPRLRPTSMPSLQLQPCFTFLVELRRLCAMKLCSAVKWTAFQNTRQDAATLKRCTLFGALMCLSSHLREYMLNMNERRTFSHTACRCPICTRGSSRSRSNPQQQSWVLKASWSRMSLLHRQLGESVALAWAGWSRTYWIWPVLWTGRMIAHESVALARAGWSRTHWIWPVLWTAWMKTHESVALARAGWLCMQWSDSLAWGLPVAAERGKLVVPSRWSSSDNISPESSWQTLLGLKGYFNVEHSLWRYGSMEPLTAQKRKERAAEWALRC